jgi:putative restriction endonuclease
MKDHERATQVWAVLAWAATNRQVITYEILSQLIGVPAVGLAGLLGHVQSYCSQSKLPLLNCIVVGKDTGLPGPGCEVEKMDVPKAQAEVFRHDWLSEAVPSPETLEAACEDNS